MLIAASIQCCVAQQKESTVVPVTGIDYHIPRSPANMSFDWRPNFYVSPDTHVQAGRFGLSLRVAF